MTDSNITSCSSGISRHSTIREIITRFPETTKIFRHYGYEIYETSSNSDINLGEALDSHNIDSIGFIRLLEEQIPKTFDSVPGSLAERNYDQHGLNLLALMPCPLKVPFEQALSDLIIREWDDIPPFTHLIESNANNQLSYYQHVRNFDDIRQMPDVVISPGLNGYYFQDFFHKFKNKNHFVDLMKTGQSPYLNLNLQDPDHQYSVLGANIEVLLIDQARLGDREIPERWSDLLKPEYQNSLTVRGQDGFFCETVLLSIFAEFGLEGVRQFAKTVRNGSHPSQMVKAAGSRQDDVPPISIMPLFFAKLAKKSSDLSIVFPEEGPIVSPVTMIIKRDHPEAMNPVISFITGKETGKIFSQAWFPSMTSVSPCIEPDAPFNWLGWDYITIHDLGMEIDLISSEFSKIFYGKKS